MLAMCCDKHAVKGAVPNFMLVAEWVYHVSRVCSVLWAITNLDVPPIDTHNRATQYEDWPRKHEGGLFFTLFRCFMVNQYIHILLLFYYINNTSRRNIKLALEASHMACLDCSTSLVFSVFLFHYLIENAYIIQYLLKQMWSTRWNNFPWLSLQTWPFVGVLNMSVSAK